VAAGQYEVRRTELVAQLERIYGELDNAVARGDQGQSA